MSDTHCRALRCAKACQAMVDPPPKAGEAFPMCLVCTHSKQSHRPINYTKRK